MNCDRRLLSQYRDGELSPGQRRLVDEHLISCEECRKTLRDYEGISQAIKTLRRYEAPRSLVKDVYARIEEDRFGSSVGLKWSDVLRFGSLAAATFVLVLIGSTVFRTAPLSESGPRAGATSAASAYVERTSPPAVVAGEPTPAVGDQRPGALPAPAAVQQPPQQMQTLLEPTPQVDSPEDKAEQTRVEPPPIQASPSPAAAPRTPPNGGAPGPVLTVVPQPTLPPQGLDVELPNAAPSSTPESVRAVAAVPPALTAEPAGTSGVSPMPAPPATPGLPSIAATTEITGGTSVSTTVQCPVVPKRGFGLVYSSSPETQQRLGCAVSEEKALVLAQEAFESGQVFWRSDSRHIYVLSSKGTWKLHKDTWAETDPPTPTPAPPEGKFAPIRGIGKLWREDLTVRATLGWATEVERGYSGAIQDFEEGVMIWSDRKVIHVLYADGTWQYFVDTYTDDLGERIDGSVRRWGKG